MARRDGGAVGRMGIRIVGVVAGFLILALVIVGVNVVRGHSGGSATAAAPAQSTSVTTRAQSSPSPEASIPVPSLSATQLAALPRSTTYTTVRGLPASAHSEGNVVRIDRDEAGFASPGGTAKVVIPPTEIGLDTWLPVVGRRPGWLQVRLPSRPNGSLAWIPAAGLRTAQTDWRVSVSLGAGTMSVTKGGARMGQWSIGQGKVATPLLRERRSCSPGSPTRARTSHRSSTRWAPIRTRWTPSVADPGRLPCTDGRRRAAGQERFRTGAYAYPPLRCRYSLSCLPGRRWTSPPRSRALPTEPRGTPR